MSIYQEDIIDIDLERGSLHRSFMNHAIGAGDGAAHRFGIRPKRNGEPVSLIGAACVGYMIRPDGITLVINGVTQAGEAYVELPEAAYAIEGNFSLSIKVTGTGFTDTVRIVDGTIVRTTTGEIMDPADTIPSLADLTAVIGRAEDAAEVINSLTIQAQQITGTRYKIAVTKE